MHNYTDDDIKIDWFYFGLMFIELVGVLILFFAIPDL